MLWLTWRQFRTQAAVVFGVLAAVAIVLAVTGPHLVHLYDTTVKPCASHDDCGTETGLFTAHDRLLQQLTQVVLVAPALIGMFWGAPLVARELEHNTFRLAWTQSVSRTRWLAIKLGLVGAASMVVAGLLSLMVSWWSSPFDRIIASPFAPSYYDRRDLVPIGYAAFAFALGVTAGVLIRRTLPAMAATLVGFVAVRAAVFAWIRPRLMTPLTVTIPFRSAFSNRATSAGPVTSSDWVLSEQTIDGSGRVVGQNGGFGPNGNFDIAISPRTGTLTVDGHACPGTFRVPRVSRFGGGPPSRALTNAAQACLDKLRIREVVTYQPGSRYWAFQWYETAIFIGVALALAGFCIWWVRRRLA
jgi:hypothetical protein